MNKSIIYAKAFGTLYKLLYIVIRNDESIYVYFPRKKGYLITNKQDVELAGQKTKTISFEKNIYQDVFNPYISFHPGKGVIHINAKDKLNKDIRFLEDRNGPKLNELIGSKGFVPYTTIVIPPYIFNFDTVDVPNKNNLIANIPERKPQALSIDILVHEKGGYIDANDLPFARIRQLAFMGRLNDNLSKTLTYTLAFNNVPLQSKELPTKIIAFVWNKSIPFSFCLDPIK